MSNGIYDEDEAYASDDEMAYQLANGGIHGGGALNRYEGVRTVMTQEGVAHEMSCRSCGNRARLILDWDELITVGSNGPGISPLAPAGWFYSPANGGLVVMQRCPKCGADGADQNHFGFYVVYQPEEARKAVQTGMQRGFIPRQLYEAKMMQIQAARGGPR